MTALSFVWVHPYSQNSRCDNCIYGISVSFMVKVNTSQLLTAEDLQFVINFTFAV